MRCLCEHLYVCLETAHTLSCLIVFSISTVKKVKMCGASLWARDTEALSLVLNLNLNPGLSGGELLCSVSRGSTWSRVEVWFSSFSSDRFIHVVDLFQKCPKVGYSFVFLMISCVSSDKLPTHIHQHVPKVLVYHSFSLLKNISLSPPPSPLWL